MPGKEGMDPGDGVDAQSSGPPGGTRTGKFLGTEYQKKRGGRRSEGHDLSLGGNIDHEEQDRKEGVTATLRSRIRIRAEQSRMTGVWQNSPDSNYQIVGDSRR